MQAHTHTPLLYGQEGHTVGCSRVDKGPRGLELGCPEASMLYTTDHHAYAPIELGSPKVSMLYTTITPPHQPISLGRMGGYMHTSGSVPANRLVREQLCPAELVYP